MSKIMTQALNFNRTLIAVGVTISLLVVLVFAMQSPLISGNEAFSLALTIDLIITVPLVYYLLIRKSEIPKTTIVPVLAAGLAIGSYFLPIEEQTYLNYFKTWALPIIELSIVTYLIFKVRTAIQAYQKVKGETLDFFDAVKTTCSEFLPAAAITPVATEVAVFYYGFISWKNEQLKSNEFSYHKNSGSPALFAALILVIAIETVAFHFLLAKWSMIAAWVITALSVYTAVQIFGFIKSLSKRPITIKQDSLSLRYGILNEVEIAFSDIVKVELSKKPLIEDDLSKSLSPLGESEGHNIIISVKKTYRLKGLYGITKKFKTIAFYLDEPSDFQAKMEIVLLERKNHDKY
jgi:hypothetical protein